MRERKGRESPLITREIVTITRVPREVKNGLLKRVFRASSEALTSFVRLFVFHVTC